MKNKKKFLRGTFLLLCTISFFYISINISTMWQTSATEDVTPPEVLSLEIEDGSKIIDTQHSDQEVRILMEIKDDISGVGNNLQLRMRPQSEVEHEHFVDFGFQKLEEDMYLATGIFPKWIAKGTWFIEHIIVTDKVGNERTMGTKEIQNLPGVGEEGVKIFNSSPTEDVTPPELVEFQILNKEINTEFEDQEVTIIVKVIDTQSGIHPSGGGIQARFIPRSASPGQGQVKNFYFEPIEGIGNEDKYVSTATFPTGSAKGDWMLEEFMMRDQIGNSKDIHVWRDSKEEQKEIFESQYGQGEAKISNLATREDLSSPELISFSLTPTVFDTSKGDVLLTIEMRITDDMAGVDLERVEAHIRPLISTQQLSISQIELSEGDHLDGIYKKTFTIPQYSKAGIWRVDTVFTEDNVSNSSNYKYDTDFISKIPEAEGYVLINTANANEVEIEREWTIASDNANITFPAGTIVTKSEGGIFAFYRMLNQYFGIEEFQNFDEIIETINNQKEEEDVNPDQILNTTYKCDEQEECLETEITDNGFDGELIGILRAGIPGLNIKFSKPIQITIKNLKEYENYTLTIQTFKEGGEEWSEKDLCKVKNGLCTFTTEHASFFGMSIKENPETLKENLPETGFAITSTVSLSLTSMLIYTLLVKYILNKKEDVQIQHQEN